MIVLIEKMEVRRLLTNRKRDRKEQRESHHERSMPQNARAMTWRDLHARYARLLWALHSAWALISGIVVLVLARNRYGFLRWVVLFLALTWGSTLFFSRLNRFAQSVVSYLTRVMYQETLFFLIPFYFYSSTFPSWNSLYVLVLSAFAVLSCFDLLFDRLLREHRWFAIGFFAFVSFSALQFLLPLLLGTHIDIAELIAASIAFIAAVALVGRWKDVRVAIIFAAVLVAVQIFRPLLPPVPLRMTSLRFAGALERSTLRTSPQFDKEIPSSELRRGRIYAVATVFSPERVPAQMQMRFLQHGKVLRASRLLELTAQPGGFRIWDSIRVSPDERDPIRVELWTGRQLLGKRDIRVTR